MSFTGHEDHNINLETASKWTKNFRNTISEGETIAEFFGKDHIQEILNQADCVGIRIYYSLDDTGKKHLIICGAKANEDDIYTGMLAEAALGSPPFSGVTNPLNN